MILSPFTAFCDFSVAFARFSEAFWPLCVFSDFCGFRLFVFFGAFFEGVFYNVFSGVFWRFSIGFFDFSLRFFGNLTSILARG